MHADREALATLQSRLIDAAKGHGEAAELAEDAALSALFRDLREQHDRHAAELAAWMTAHGMEADEDGSFLQYVHKAVLNARSMLGGIDENTLPAIRDGEERILDLYDDTIRTNGGDAGLADLLKRQREAAYRNIARLKTLETAAGVQG